MVTLVFVAVLLAAFALDWWVIQPWESRHRPRSVAPVNASLEFVVPRTLFFHPGHTWARLDGDGKVTVGVDDFARTLLEDLRRIEVPEIGEKVEAGTSSMTVRQETGRLALVAPISGIVTEVNREFGSDPTRLRWRPYKEAWTYRLAPGDDLAVELGRLNVGRDAERWMRQELDRLSSLIDAGVLDLPVEGSVQRAGDEARRRVEREIFRVESLPVEAAT